MIPIPHRKLKAMNGSRDQSAARKREGLMYQMVFFSNNLKAFCFEGKK